MLSKLGIVSFSVVLISAIIKRMIRDLKEVRGDIENDDEYESEYDSDDEVEYEEKKVMRF